LRNVEKEATISALQADSEQRIARYQRLKSEAAQSGNQVLARKWAREVSDETKLLAVIKRVEALNEAEVQSRKTILHDQISLEKVR
jgi:flagellar motor switch protein FliG